MLNVRVISTRLESISRRTDALGHTSTINFVPLLCRTKRALNHFSICSHFPAINEHHQRGHRVVRWCYFYIFYRFLRVAQLTKRIKGVKNSSKSLKIVGFWDFLVYFRRTLVLINSMVHCKKWTKKKTNCPPFSLFRTLFGH